MKAKQLFLLTIGIVAALIAIIGVASVLTLKDTVIVLTFDSEPPDAAAIQLTQEVLEQRIKAFAGVFDVRSGKVEYCKPNFIVTLRGHKAFSAFSEVLTEEGRVQLYLTADSKAHEAYDATGRIPQGYRPHEITHELVKLGTWGDTHKSEEAVLLREQPEMVICRVKAAHMARNGWFRAPVITIEFDEQQSRQFSELTKKHEGERLALAVEGEVFTAPEIQGEIPDGIVQIKNIVYFPKAERLYNLLRIGALPAPLKIVEIRPPAGTQPTVPPKSHEAPPIDTAVRTNACG